MNLIERISAAIICAAVAFAACFFAAVVAFQIAFPRLGGLAAVGIRIDDDRRVTILLEGTTDEGEELDDDESPFDPLEPVDPVGRIEGDSPEDDPASVSFARINLAVSRAKLNGANGSEPPTDYDFRILSANGYNPDGTRIDDSPIVDERAAPSA